MAVDWIWIDADVARAIHTEQIAERGGPSGVLDDAGLEGAMARAQNLAADGSSDAADLVTAYAYGTARDHPFVDGDKRTAAVVSETFLALNGFTLDASDAELMVAFHELAAGELTQAELAGWFRHHVA